MQASEPFNIIIQVLRRRPPNATDIMRKSSAMLCCPHKTFTSINLAQAGTNAQARHDDMAWDSKDSAWRANMTDVPLSFRACCIEFRGDLPERAARSGLKSTTSKQGCMSCNCDARELHSHYDEWTIDRCPHPTRTTQKLRLAIVHA